MWGSHGDGPVRALDGDQIAGADPEGAVAGAGHARHSELAGDDRPVAHGAAYVDDQGRRAVDVWGPGRIGGLADQDVTVVELDSRRVEDHPRDAGDGAG